MNHSLLQEILNDAVDRHQVVGAQLALVADDEVIAVSSGSANIAQELSMTTDTLIQIGSVAKVYNAAIVNCLVDDGLLDLDTPINVYVPELKLSDSQARDQLTLRHLLTMSSGMDNGPSTDFGRGDDCVGKYVAALGGVPHHFEPGSSWGYSNASSILAGHVAERVTGTCWDDLLHEKILDPAELMFSESIAERLVFHRVAVGYTPSSDGPVANTVWWKSRGQGPAGSTMAASAKDLVRFGHMFCSGGKILKKQIVTSNAVDKMNTPEIDCHPKSFGQRWALGPDWTSWDGIDVLGHHGANINGVSRLSWIPQENVTVAVLCNTPRANTEFLDPVIDAVLGETCNISRPDQSIECSRPSVVDAQRYTGRWGSYDTTLVIRAADGILKANIQMPGAEFESVLTPAGNDLFDVDLPWTFLPPQIGFSNEDNSGLPKNYVFGLFPGSRLE